MDEQAEDCISKVIQMIKQEIKGNAIRTEASPVGTELESQVSLLMANYHVAQKEKDCLEMKNIDLLSREIELNSKCVRYQMQVAIMENTTKEQERQLQLKDDEIKNIRSILEQRVEDENRDSMRRDIKEYELSSKIADDEEILNGMEVLLAEKEAVIEQLESKIHHLTEEIFKVNEIIDKQHIALEDGETRVAKMAGIKCDLENENKLLRSRIHEINKKSEILKGSLKNLEDNLLSNKGKDKLKDLQRNLKRYESKFDQITDSLLEFGQENEYLTVKICDILNEVIFQEHNQIYDGDGNDEDDNDDDDYCDGDNYGGLYLPVVERGHGEVSRNPVLNAEIYRIKSFPGNKSTKSYGMLLFDDTNEEQSPIVITNGNDNEYITTNSRALSENNHRHENDKDLGRLFANRKNTHGISKTGSKTNLLVVNRRAKDNMADVPSEIRKQNHDESMDTAGNGVGEPVLGRTISNEEKILGDLSTAEWHLQGNLGIQLENDGMMQQTEKNEKGWNDLSGKAKRSRSQGEFNGSAASRLSLIEGKTNDNTDMDISARSESGRDFSAYSLDNTLKDNGGMSLNGVLSDNDLEYKVSDVVSILDENSNKNSLPMEGKLSNQGENCMQSEVGTDAGEPTMKQMQNDNNSGNEVDMEGVLPTARSRKDDTIPTNEEGDNEMCNENGINKLCDMQEIDEADADQHELGRLETIEPPERKTETRSNAAEFHTGDSESGVIASVTKATNTVVTEKKEEFCVETDFASAVEAQKLEQSLREPNNVPALALTERECIQGVGESNVEDDFAPTVEKSRAEDALVEADVPFSIETLRKNVKEAENTSVESEMAPETETSKIKYVEEIEDVYAEIDFAPAIETTSRIEEGSQGVDGTFVLEAPRIKDSQEIEEATVKADFVSKIETSREEAIGKVDLSSSEEALKTEDLKETEEVPLEDDIAYAVKQKEIEKVQDIEKASEEVNITSVIETTDMEAVQGIEEALLHANFAPKVKTSKTEDGSKEVDFTSKREALKMEGAGQKEDASIDTDFISAVDASRTEYIQNMTEVSEEVDFKVLTEAPNVKDPEKMEATAEVGTSPARKTLRLNEGTMEAGIASVPEAIELEDARNIEEDRVCNIGEGKPVTSAISSDGKVDEMKCLNMSADNDKIPISGKLVERPSREYDDKSIVKGSPLKQRRRNTEAATMNMRIASPTRWSVEIPSNLVSSLIKENVELRTEVEGLLNEKSVLVNEVDNLKFGSDTEKKLRHEIDSVVAEKLLLHDQIMALKGIMLDFDEKYKDEITALKTSQGRLKQELEQMKANLVEKEEYLKAAKERETYLVGVNEKSREEIAGLEAKLCMLNPKKDKCEKCTRLRNELEETRREAEELKTKMASNAASRDPNTLDHISTETSSPDSMDLIDDSYGADNAANFSGANRMKKKKKYAIFCS